MSIDLQHVLQLAGYFVGSWASGYFTGLTFKLLTQVGEKI